MSNPTKLVSQFADSLAYTDQSGAGVWTGAGPEWYDDGLELTEQQTNYVYNPWAAVDATTGIQVSGSSSRSRDTGDQVLGPASFECHVEGGAVAWDIDTPIASDIGANDPVAFGVYLKSATSITVPVDCVIFWNSFANHRIETLNCVLTGGADWVWFEGAFVLGPAEECEAATLRVLSTPALDFQASGLHVVKGSGVARPIPAIDSGGTIISGWTWSGASHASASTRAASSAAISPAGILSPTTGALAFRLTPTIETGLEEIWGECGAKGSGTDHLRWGRDASKHPFVEWSSNDAAYQRLTASETIDAGTQAFIYLGHDGTAITLQVDAGSLQSDTRDAVEDDFSTGDLTLQASAGGAIYDDFATFDRTLTATEIAQVRRAGSFSLGMFDGNPYIHFQLRPY